MNNGDFYMENCPHPVKRIGFAVIKLAVLDLRKYIRSGNKNKVLMMKNFFISDDFEFWSDLDGKVLYNQILKDETNEHNKAFIRDLYSR